MGRYNDLKCWSVVGWTIYSAFCTLYSAWIIYSTKYLNTSTRLELRINWWILVGLFQSWDPGSVPGDSDKNAILVNTQKKLMAYDQSGHYLRSEDKPQTKNVSDRAPEPDDGKCNLFLIIET